MIPFIKNLFDKLQETNPTVYSVIVFVLFIVGTALLAVPSFYPELALPSWINWIVITINGLLASLGYKVPMLGEGKATEEK